MSSGTSYFDQVSSQLEVTVGKQMSGVVSGVSANAEAGVSPSINALDTGLKAATALGSLADNVSEAAILPVLGALGMKGQACLPISKQLDPVIGVDIHLVNIPPATSVPMPHPYVGTLLCPQDFMTAAVAVTNTGTWPGSEVVQLYIRDVVGSSTRPVKELKGFQKIFLEPGEMKIVRFKIAPEMLRYYNYDLQLVAEPGDFEVMIGTNSRDVKTARFTLN